MSNQQIQPEQQPLAKKTYLVHITDGEESEKFIISSPSVMQAVMLFAERYQEICADWTAMDIVIEEIETLE